NATYTQKVQKTKVDGDLIFGDWPIGGLIFSQIKRSPEKSHSNQEINFFILMYEFSEKLKAHKFIIAMKVKPAIRSLIISILLIAVFKFMDQKRKIINRGLSTSIQTF
ncbi:MAG: hypothetical protein KAT07_10980, partial [Calditrichia bacterium]|nr:hypothetical protein [Calditrichia bacterium]